MRKRVKVLIVVTGIVAVVTVPVLVVLSSHRAERASVKAEVADAQWCFHETKDKIAEHAEDLARDSRTLDAAESLAQRLLDLAEYVTLEKNGPYGAFEDDGMTGEQFCAKVRTLYLEADAQRRLLESLPVITPSPSVSVSPSPSASS